MPHPDTIALAAEAEAQGLEAVLVGGNAVNLVAYSRTTFDLDLLIREGDAERWLAYFKTRGYAISRRTENFIRLRLEADPAAALPVDLMLASEGTFGNIQAESRRADIGHGLCFAIPSPFHLIAMKLHALRNPLRAEMGIDLQDIRHLIRVAEIDVSSPEFMPPMGYDKRSETNSQSEHARESARLDLPEFDSSPATAGLSNLEAFQLSQRHALALLPALFAKGQPEDRADEVTERFSID